MNDPFPENGSPRSENRVRDFAVLGSFLILFLIGLSALAAATGWEETKNQLAKLSFLQVLVLLGLSMANYILRAVRWHILSWNIGGRLPLQTSMLHFIAGFAASMTPARIGELIRLRWIARKTGLRLEHLAPLPLADRAFDLAAMGLLLGASVLVSQSNAGAAGAIPVAVLAFATACLVTRPAFLARLVGALWKLVGRWPRPFARLRKSAQSLQVLSGKEVSLPAIILSMIGWIAEGVALFLLLSWMGAEISLAASMVIFLFATMAGGLTGAPGGIGGAEAAMVILLGLNGVPMAIAIPATAIIRLTTLWFAIGLGVLTFPLAEARSRRV